MRALENEVPQLPAVIPIPLLPHETFVIRFTYLLEDALSGFQGTERFDQALRMRSLSQSLRLGSVRTTVSTDRPIGARVGRRPFAKKVLLGGIFRTCRAVFRLVLLLQFLGAVLV